MTRFKTFVTIGVQFSQLVVVNNVGVMECKVVYGFK